MISQKVKKDSVEPQKEAAISSILKTTEKKPTEPIENTKENIIIENNIDRKLDLLQQMFTKFIETNQQDKNDFIKNIDDFKVSVNSRLGAIANDSPRDFADTPITDRYEENRRSSMFFGSPYHSPPVQQQIQVLKADIVYEKELKVSSLEGLQYLSKQLQILSSKYPGREIKTAHMVSFGLRPHVIAAWNSHCYKEYIITGLEPQEVMVEDWLTLSNSTVNQMLLEAARPRTKELYARELILFLGKGIPQTPLVNTENFSKLFYIPLIKSLNDILHLHALLSEETSNTSNNKLKMPVSGYGTRDSPGHIALWLISLGTQKEAILQWLGKDDLSKYKSIEQAVKYIRNKLMEARSQSEAHQDLDSKLTPIRYDEIRHTAGESNARQQINVPTVNKHYFKPSFSALDCETNSENHPYSISTSEGNKDCEEYDDSLDYPSEVCDDHRNSAPDQLEHDNDTPDFTFTNMDTTRNAIASTFRGFCCELFVFGKCMKKESTCNFDHSTKGQENCQQSFLLLAKRNLSDHANLPPYPKPTKDATSTSRSFQLSQTQQTHRPSVTTTQRPHLLSTPNRYGSK